MIIPDGKRHKGRPTELILLADPFYVKLTLAGKCPDGNMPEVKKDFIRLIALFDEKKLLCRCTSCQWPAKLISFFKSTLYNQPWCGFCTPFWLNNDAWEFDVFTDYRSALDYVEFYCNDDKIFYRKIIRHIAVLKGFTDKLGAREAIAFFSSKDELNALEPSRRLYRNWKIPTCNSKNGTDNQIRPFNRKNSRH